jgi:serine/threonine protein kinase
VSAPELHGFRFVREIGRGGSSEVLLYEQSLPRRLVAVKIAKAGVSGPFDEEAWIAEATAMARVEHPNIVPIYATAVTSDGRPYIVMSFYPNGSLSERLREAPLQVNAALDLGVQIAGALESIHRMGFMHGDVKPPNILFDSFNRPGLSDFGASVGRAVQPRGVSVPWAPPEAIYSAAPLEPYSDVYSLAATLWNALSGIPPYAVAQGDNSAMAMVRRMRDEPVANLHADSVPSSLEKILRRSLAEDPSLRPQSAFEFGQILQGAQRDLRLPVTEMAIVPLPESSDASRDSRFPQSSEPHPRADLVASADNNESNDELGREVLAAHLAGVMNQLARQHATSDSTAEAVVIHLDGRWGAGKSILMRLVARRLASSLGPATPHVANPILVWVDAWTQAKSAPAWWNIITGIKREVERERSPLSRIVMTILGGLSRVFSSGPFLWAIVGVALAFVFATHSNLTVASGVLTLATGAAALALGLGRAFVWAAPAIGRLYLSTESDPMGEVNRIVSDLRRWSPRRFEVHTATIRGALICAAWSLTSLAVLLPQSRAIMEPLWISAAGGLLAGLLSLLAGRPQTGPKKWGDALRASVLWGIPVVGLVLSVTFLGSFATSILRVTGAGGYLLVMTPAVIGLGGYFWELRRVLRSPRRPVLLVIDDLDRCSVDQVYDYLETLHAIAQHGDRSHGRRAQILAVAISDGRWIRSAFETHYSAFSELGDPTRSMAADFTQKLFDHVVLVPDLNAQQKNRFLGVVTDGEYAAAVVDESTQVRPVMGLPAVRGAMATPRSHSHKGDEPEPALTAEAITFERVIATAQVKQRIAEKAHEALVGASEEAARRKVDHLLVRYAGIMPGNPRLIRRVANTWGMLFALGDHIDAHVSNDTLARAAVFFVRFPSLVDLLLTTSEPPLLLVAQPDRASIWWRSDVMEVLRLPSGSVLQPKLLGECFGKRYPAPAMSIHQKVSWEVVEGTTTDPEGTVGGPFFNLS